MSHFYNILVQMIWAAVKHTEQGVSHPYGHKGATGVYFQNFNVTAVTLLYLE